MNEISGNRPHQAKKALKAGVIEKYRHKLHNRALLNHDEVDRKE